MTTVPIHFDSDDAGSGDGSDRGLRPHQQVLLHHVARGTGKSMVLPLLHGAGKTNTTSALNRLVPLQGARAEGSSVLDVCVRQSVTAMHLRGAESLWHAFANSSPMPAMKIHRHTLYRDPLTDDVTLDYEVSIKEIQMPELPDQHKPYITKEALREAADFWKHWSDVIRSDSATENPAKPEKSENTTQEPNEQ